MVMELDKAGFQITRVDGREPDRVGLLIQDTDGDGLTDGIELSLFITDPLDYDTNENGLSDAEDLLNSGEIGATCSGDTNNDGSITVGDLLLVLSAFGGICS